jgi:hypothetical protein
MGRWSIALALVLWAEAAAAGPPQDPRLDTQRAALDQAFAAAIRDGVPESLLADKIKEGLAKNVPLPRISQAVWALETSYAEAVRLSAPHVSSPPRELLTAISEARMAGAQPREIEALLALHRGLKATNQAVDMLTDLILRRFPSDAAERAVASVIVRAPREINRVVVEAQALRSSAGMSPRQALDAIAAMVDHGASDEHAGQGNSPLLDDRGPNRETSGQRGPAPNSHGAH